MYFLFYFISHILSLVILLLVLFKKNVAMRLLNKIWIW